MKTVNETGKAKLDFAREAEKTEKKVMGVVNGEKNGVAAVAVGKCSKAEAEAVCEGVSLLAEKFPKGSFSCVFDGKEKVRLDLCGDIRFVAAALELLDETGCFGESL